MYIHISYNGLRLPIQNSTSLTRTNLV